MTLRCGLFTKSIAGTSSKNININCIAISFKNERLHHKEIRQVHELETSHKTINLHLNLI